MHFVKQKWSCHPMQKSVWWLWQAREVGYRSVFLVRLHLGDPDRSASLESITAACRQCSNFGRKRGIFSGWRKKKPVQNPFFQGFPAFSIFNMGFPAPWKKTYKHCLQSSLLKQTLMPRADKRYDFPWEQGTCRAHTDGKKKIHAILGYSDGF